MNHRGLGMRLRGSPLIVALFIATITSSASPDQENSTTQPAATCRVKLSWKTETETDAFGYLVYRGTAPDKLECINADSPLHAAGTTTTPARYRYYDLDVECGTTYYYRVAAVDLDGTEDRIIGDKAPAETAAKPLTDEEKAEVKEYGAHFRLEESGETKSAPGLAPR